MSDKSTAEVHWKMATRDGPWPLNLEKAVEAMAWLVVGHTSPPYEFSRGRLEDGNGNEVVLDHVADVVNHVPSLLIEVRRLRAALQLICHPGLATADEAQTIAHKALTTNGDLGPDKDLLEEVRSLREALSQSEKLSMTRYDMAVKWQKERDEARSEVEILRGVADAIESLLAEENIDLEEFTPYVAYLILKDKLEARRLLRGRK